LTKHKGRTKSFSEYLSLWFNPKPGLSRYPCGAADNGGVFVIIRKIRQRQNPGFAAGSFALGAVMEEIKIPPLMADCPVDGLSAPCHKHWSKLHNTRPAGCKSNSAEGQDLVVTGPATNPCQDCLLSGVLPATRNTHSAREAGIRWHLLTALPLNYMLINPFGNMPKEVMIPLGF